MPAAFVISLDFELHWGVRDRQAAWGGYRESVLGARAVIPKILDLFEEFEVAATWATVGFLFARNRSELDRFKPAVIPGYDDQRLNPYEESIGENETDDPVHFAGSLVDRIRRTPGQEIATHTFSHYFCCEPGQNLESFRADIEAAVAIAKERGISLHSIVFPRNQFNPSYAAVLLENGIVSYRGNPPGWMWDFATAEEARKPWLRVGRIAEAFLPLGGRALTDWDSIRQPTGLNDIAATQFLRPQLRWGWLRDLHVRRIRGLVREAARSKRLFHLWWHPHNFGRNQERSLRMLRTILEEFAECRQQHDMISLNMSGVTSMLGAGLSSAAVGGVHVSAG